MHAIAEKISVVLTTELENILNYWSKNSIDEINDGFIGERDHFNKIVPNATKGIILNSRILWSFSAASNHYKTDKYTTICKRSYNYLETFFKDELYGGVYWELTSEGTPINKRKQVYAQAFMIYALSEYYQFSKNNDALDWAIEIYNLIEIHANDQNYKGYIEAFNEDWSVIKDMRLSDKDANEAKTMNTHLHILEAYTNLYKVYKNESLKKKLDDLIHLFLDKFLTNKNHLNLFFDEKWNLKSNIVSYGHDIETAWLLIEAAKVINNNELLLKTNNTAVLIAETFIKEGVDVDGGVYNEYNPTTNKLDGDKHWWPQAEALVGLNYAYKISKNEAFLNVSKSILNFLQHHIIDHTNGEWFWRVDKNQELYTTDYKMGMWKAPYHNSRACMLLSK
ncbi:mannobiose 2-epimerase [Lutibacter agarilyticus]|uniref:Cellobiose 2-epimerase n=1 Tax=Lutibacter agarilyticus TaxID=1109740 RepID=A0A238WPD0_9FLAO|nr:AGE family epimerase/isomerase [Lutibacter agarilyticus]SNR48173.1 mannobiose 2-epimerase [Lutibacter agarilyticus]